MAMECVVDTNVLQKANAPIEQRPPKEGRQIHKRLALLQRIRQGELKILYSHKLMAEYRNKITTPRNDFISAFFALITSGQSAVLNWPSPWKVKMLEAQECRFPVEDYHVLRTAIRPETSTIFSEEGRILATDKCIYRRLRIRIVDPVA